MSNKLGTVLPNISSYIENANKPVFSYLSTLTTRHCPHPSAAAAAAAIDRYLVLTGPIAANLQQWVCCFWAMLKQTDRYCTVTQNPALHTMWAVPIHTQTHPFNVPER